MFSVRVCVFLLLGVWAVTVEVNRSVFFPGDSGQGTRRAGVPLAEFTALTTGTLTPIVLNRRWVHRHLQRSLQDISGMFLGQS